jgi:hypothetical protein
MVSISVCHPLVLHSKSSDNLCLKSVDIVGAILPVLARRACGVNIVM